MLQSATSAATLQVSSISNRAKAEFWIGFEDWQNFAHNSAERHFERALSLDPSLGLARVLAAGAFWARNEPLPMSDMERGVADAARTSTVEGVLALAWREKTTNGEAIAIPLLRLATELLPNDPHVATEYVLSLATKDAKAALEFGQAVKARFPRFAALAATLSYVSLRTGDTASALAEGRRYTELAPTLPASFAAYGDLLAAIGRFDDAEAQYRSALALTRHADYYAEGNLGLAALMELRGDPAAARQLLAVGLHRAITVPDSIGYLQALGGASIYAGDISSAMSDFETLTRVSSAVRNVSRYTGTISMALTNAAFGDGRSVARYLSAVHPQVPSDTAAIEQSFAVIYGYAGQMDSAFKYADHLLARSSANAVAGHVGHFARGQAYLATHRCGEALNEFRQSDDTSVEVQAGMAECEMEFGNRSAALQWRDRALAVHAVNFFDPGEIRARMRMALLR